MKRQGRRATLLTLLALLAVNYLPLTLVTGIFGINIKETAKKHHRFLCALRPCLP